MAIVGSNKITLTAGWIPAASERVPADYVGGLVKWQSADGVEERGILRAEGLNDIVMTGPALGMFPQDDVEVSLGCPHTLEGCGLIHQNLPNFGGQPFIPTFNPLNKNNHT